MDNDKLQVKVLQSKRNIQRLRLERAILYERLSSRQSFPNAHPTPPAHTYPPPHNHHQSREPVEPNLVVADPNDAAAVEWYRSRGIPVRVVTGSDGQPVQVAEATFGPPPTPGSHTPTSASSRYPSGHRDSRQPVPPPMPSAQHLEPSHPYDRHQGSHNPYTHPPTTPSSFRSRSRGAHGPGPLQTAVFWVFSSPASPTRAQCLPVTAITHLGTMFPTANDELIVRVLMSHPHPGYSHPYSRCRVLTHRVPTLTCVRQ
ncbi:hypothetical protein EDB89DRAFT_491229 [Lactarius sanguifluus]|nr:hypothetical protein EDB89DRAFT_491229 [Lactarius sanguifluus]